MYNAKAMELYHIYFYDTIRLLKLLEKGDYMIQFGIDLGANSLRLINEDEILFNEPCAIAVDKSNHTLAIGKEALEIKKSKDDAIQILWPITSNHINFDALDALLEQLCYQFKVFKKFHKTTILLSYPTSLNEDRCNTLKQHLIDLGANRVYSDCEIWFSAIGAGLNITLPITHCVMNIGSSNCDIATFANGRIQNKFDFSLAGNQVMLAIQRYLKYEKHISVNYTTLDTIQRTIGCVQVQPIPRTIEIFGTNTNTKEETSIIISENDLVPILSPLVKQWVQWISKFLQQLNPEQKEDILRQGIIACGGTMKLKGIQQEFFHRLKIPFYITDQPTETVCKGMQILLSNMH